jgi:hypothetical protein
MVLATADQRGSLRRRLGALMVEAPSVQVREAAARSMVVLSEPGAQLRVVEWGVLVASDVGYVLPQAIIDEIPPFVHRTGNPLAELEQTRPRMFISAKPIIHLTASAPMAVDIEIYIRGGRPWFAYPKPDDMVLQPMRLRGQQIFNSRFRPNVKMEQFDNAALGKIQGLAEGYPWTTPQHRELVNARAYDALGLRWQSLIVSPQQHSWMHPPQAPTDAKYQWWPALRKVPASWVCNRGESERFIYYDGPTTAPAPVTVRRIGSAIEFEVRREFLPDFMRNAIGGTLAQTAEESEQKGLFLEVRGGAVRWAVMVLSSSGRFELQVHDGTESEASAQLLEMLTERGMTAEEAAGLVDAWREQFFRTDGARFITRMAPDDYDLLFPMRIRPKPSTLIRVGLILTEFDSARTTQPA